MIQFDLQSFIATGLIQMPVSMPSKAPAGGFSHQSWNAAKPTPVQIEAAWAKHGHAADGVALLCGYGLEMLDIDIQADPLGKIDVAFRNALVTECPDIYAKLVIESTLSGGTHYWYRVPTDYGSTKLAKIGYTDADRWALGDKYKDAKFGTIIETRGRGGYGVCAPTPGYKLMERELTSVKELTEEERDILWQIARSFSTYVEEQTYIKNEHNQGSSKPGEDFSGRISVQDFCSLFEAKGWRVISTRGQTVYLNRPGAKNSRKTDAVILQDKKLFVNYSASVSGFECEKGYSPFRCYAILDHSGDFKAAASVLKKEGYGEQEHYASAPVVAKPSEIIEKYAGLKFDLNARPNVDFNLFVVAKGATPYSPTEMYGLAFPGALIPVVGKQKSRKTTILTAIIASALSGNEVCGFLNKNKGPVLWIDTEQPDLYFWMTQWRICVQAGGHQADLHAYRLRKMNPEGRREAITELVAAIKPRTIVIDGVADIMRSVNDEESCKKIIDEWLMPLTANDTTVFPVLHLNKTDGQMSGWLGTQLGRKSDGTLQVDQVDDFSVDVGMRDARAERPPAWRLHTEKGMHGVLYKDTKPNYNYTLGYPQEEAIQQAANAPYQMSRPGLDDEDVPF